MGESYFVLGFGFCLLIQLNTGQLLPEEELRNETSCTLDVNISCSNNEIIAVHSLYFFYDSDCTNTCCTYNSSHSSIGADENDIQEIRRLCSGRESCSPALDGKRNFGLLNVQTPSYVMVQYFCIPDCEDKYNISNGYISSRDVNNTGKGSLADVSCDAGYETNKTYVSCLETGHWENATCSPKDCGNLPEIRNGEYTLKDPQNTTYGALATVNCSKGFEAKSSSISCLESGQWSRVSCTSKGQLLPEEELRNETSCTLDVNISCSNNEIIAVHSLYFFYDSDCTNRCCTYNSSHSSIGGDENDIQEIRRLCSGRESCSHALDGKRDFGSLNVQTPSYVMVQYFCIPGSRVNTICSNEEVVSQGRLPLYLTNENYPSVTTGDSTCSCSLEINSCSSNIQLHLLDIDLYLDTNTCEQSLEFVNNRDGVSEKINCESYHNNNITSMNINSHYVRINFLDNSTQNQEGYFLLGFEATGENTTFSISCPYKQESICLDCEDKYNISNGYLSPRDVNNTGKGSLADVSCDAGYETNKTYVSCLETGHWENATCSPKDCGNLPEIRNGEYTLKDPQNTTYAALATVNCSKGFEAKSSSISCLESGQWSRVSCTSKDCGNPPVIDYGSIRSEDGSTTYTSTARVTCQEGYKAKKQVITCKETGMWESSSCEPKDCGNPPVIDYGSITLEDESATYKSTARVKCQEGYKAKKLVVTCKETGMWESSSCEPTENTHDEKQQAEDGNASSTTLVAVLVSLMVIVILILAVYVIWRYRHRLCKTRSFKGHESISFKNEEVLPEDQGYQNLNISFVNEGGESKDQQCQDPNVSFKNEDIRPEISEVQPSQDSNTNIQTDEIVPEKQQCQESTVAVKTDENLPEIQLQESNVAVKTDDVLTEKDTNVDAMTAKVLHENEQGPDSNETAPNDELPENQQSQESNIAVKTDEVLTEKDKNVDAMTEKVLHENEQGQDSNVTAPNDELPENQQSQVSNVAGDSEEKEKPDQH
ncbi:uncharacterized protein LOC123551040 isoform X2 [Mercenaria mercenaria]|uniref:uncharacterized protein LOC123551040 isoform X2 n=1 Tax=Mercenaria mercenaria TaxID=6596 RepID=UPI00234E5870|nr:uncharacterized protein LOC123551040 isoform X2 [Mercenaria mercenaria]